MTDRPSILSLASAAALALALAQPVAAEGEQAPAAAPAAATPQPPATSVPAAPAAAAPTAPAPEAPAAAAEPAAAPPAAAAVDPHAAAMQRMEQRRAEMDADRSRRYDELRQRAAELGVELPETPPWEQAAMSRPEMPAMPDMGARPMWGVSPADRRTQMERMRDMTPEERMAARGESYKQLRERAATQGIELPETPPWEQAEQRRKAMQEKWDSYRKQVEAMTDQQREAAKAVFGGSPAMEAPQMPMQGPMPMEMPMEQPMGMPMGRPSMPMQMPKDMPMDFPMRGQGPRGYGPDPCPQGDCGGVMQPRGMMPGWGGDPDRDQGWPEQQGGYGGMPWGRGY